MRNEMSWGSNLYRLLTFFEMKGFPLPQAPLHWSVRDCRLNVTCWFISHTRANPKALPIPCYKAKTATLRGFWKAIFLDFKCLLLFHNLKIFSSIFYPLLWRSAICERRTTSYILSASRKIFGMRPWMGRCIVMPAAGREEIVKEMNTSDFESSSRFKGLINEQIWCG